MKWLNRFEIQQNGLGQVRVLEDGTLLQGGFASVSEAQKFVANLKIDRENAEWKTVKYEK